MARADVRDNVVQVRDEETVATLANKGDRGESGEPLGPLGGLKKLGDHAEQDRDEGLATWWTIERGELRARFVAGDPQNGSNTKRKGQTVEALGTDAVVVRVNLIIIVVLKSCEINSEIEAPNNASNR